jgi:murein DD-endopeptidase MepM/ murein hydrolase activator NlpD
VARIASSNGIANPNRILPGQELDLASLGEDGIGGPSPTRERELVEILAEVFGEPHAAHDDSHGDQALWGLAVDGPARLSSKYGSRSDPFTGVPDFHHGVDLAAKSGTPILAIRPGVVTFSGQQSGYGRMVIVRHDDGLESVYAHASANLVSAGDRVEAGTPLARVGSSGRSTGPHLHFEMRRDGVAIDPLPHLERAARTQIARR